MKLVQVDVPVPWAATNPRIILQNAGFLGPVIGRFRKDMKLLNCLVRIENLQNFLFHFRTHTPGFVTMVPQDPKGCLVQTI